LTFKGLYDTEYEYRTLPYHRCENLKFYLEVLKVNTKLGKMKDDYTRKKFNMEPKRRFETIERDNTNGHVV
jgi:hypothetical protein